MMIYNCFLVSLATLIEPEQYKKEFKVATRILDILLELYPELDEETWKNFILTSYQLHHGQLSLKGRLNYLKGIVFCADYSDRIDDLMEELKKRKQEYHRQFGKKPSKHVTLAISEFTYQQLSDQIEEDARILLYTPPATYIPQ